jgi:flagellar secretion chaperone FliS
MAMPAASSAPSAPGMVPVERPAPKEAYLASEFETLTPRDLVVKLYEGAERFLRQAVDAIQAQPMQIEAVHNNCVRANAIFTELLSTLNFEVGGAIAVQLRDLYLFLLRETTEANLRKDADRISRLLPIVGTLRSAWQGIPADQASVSSIPDAQRGHSLDLRT